MAADGNTDHVWEFTLLDNSNRIEKIMYQRQLQRVIEDKIIQERCRELTTNSKLEINTRNFKEINKSAAMAADGKTDHVRECTLLYNSKRIEEMMNRYNYRESSKIKDSKNFVGKKQIGY